MSLSTRSWMRLGLSIWPRHKIRRPLRIPKHRPTLKFEFTRPRRRRAPPAPTPPPPPAASSDRITSHRQPAALRPPHTPFDRIGICGVISRGISVYGDPLHHNRLILLRRIRPLNVQAWAGIRTVSPIAPLKLAVICRIRSGVRVIQIFRPKRRIRPIPHP